MSYFIIYQGRQGVGYLILRYSVLYFPFEFETLLDVWRDSMPHFICNENILPPSGKLTCNHRANSRTTPPQWLKTQAKLFKKEFDKNMKFIKLDIRVFCLLKAVMKCYFYKMLKYFLCNFFFVTFSLLFLWRRWVTWKR